jgi:integrase
MDVRSTAADFVAATGAIPATRLTARHAAVLAPAPGAQNDATERLHLAHRPGDLAWGPGPQRSAPSRCSGPAARASARRAVSRSARPADVQAVVNRWARARAPRTVRREYAVLRAILNYALRLDMVGRSPCRGINLPEVKPLRRHIVSAAEVALLADGLGGVGQLGPMIYMAAVEGMRWGEVAGLRVGHLDFEAGTLMVRETIVRGRRGAIGLGEPKSAAGRRTLAVPAGLMAMLKDHLSEKGVAASDSEALFSPRPAVACCATPTGCLEAGTPRR